MPGFLLVVSLLFWVSCKVESGPLSGGEPAGRTIDKLPTPAHTGQAIDSIQVVRVATGLRRPVYVTHVGDDRFFAAEQQGIVRIVEDGEVLAEPFLDIQNQLATDGSERGLLGLVFHPQYTENGFFYVVYTDLNGDTSLDRFQVATENPYQANMASQKQILFIEQPYGNHNGGQLQFGPDGYLYAAFGDGGAVGDPFDNAQNPDTVLGSIIRLDVDGDEPYLIPEDNPFADATGNPLPSWLIGLRNPWAFSFDRLTGDLYIADVGQEGPEEINYLPAGYSGVNFGWPIREGNQCYEAEDCQGKGFQEPIFTYNHSDDDRLIGCAVIGGYVYRGDKYPGLAGNYFFSDYCTGSIWTLRYAEGEWVANVVYEMGAPVSSFMEGPDGELYVVTYSDGAIWEIQADD